MKQLLITIAALVLVGCGETKLPDISIHEAASEGNIEAVKQHLAAGTDVNAKGKYDVTPLHIAAGSGLGHKEIAELLIANGADVNAKVDGGRTPLHLAALMGQKEIAQLLIAKGSDVNAKSDYGTPLDVAIEENYTETADLLRKHGGKAEELKAEPPTAKAPDISIHEAAWEGNIEAVKQHLAVGTDVNPKNEHGDTPLHYAAFKDYKEIAQLLIDKGADVNAKHKYGNTPLHDAARAGRKEVANLLINKGANVNARDENGGTPLHHAALGGHTEIVELLIAKVADVNAKVALGPKQGLTALDAAIEKANNEIAALLRKHGGKTGEELKAEGK